METQIFPIEQSVWHTFYFNYNKTVVIFLFASFTVSQLLIDAVVFAMQAHMFLLFIYDCYLKNN